MIGFPTYEITDTMLQAHPSGEVPEGECLVEPYNLEYGPDPRIDWCEYSLAAHRHERKLHNGMSGGTAILSTPDPRIIEALAKAMVWETTPLAPTDPKRGEMTDRGVSLPIGKRAALLTWRVDPEKFVLPGEIYGLDQTAIARGWAELSREILNEALCLSRASLEVLLRAWREGGNTFLAIHKNRDHMPFHEGTQAIQGLHAENTAEARSSARTDTYKIEGVVTSDRMDREHGPEGTMRELELLRVELGFRLMQGITSALADVPSQDSRWGWVSYHIAERELTGPDGEEPGDRAIMEREQVIDAEWKAGIEETVGQLEAQRESAEAGVDRVRSVQFIQDVLQALGYGEIHVGVLSVEQALKQSCRTLYAPHKPATGIDTERSKMATPEHPASIWLPLSKYGTDHVFTIAELLEMVAEALTSHYMATEAYLQKHSPEYNDIYAREFRRIAGDVKSLRFQKEGGGLAVEPPYPLEAMQALAKAYNQSQRDHVVLAQACETLAEVAHQFGIEITPPESSWDEAWIEIRGILDQFPENMFTFSTIMHSRVRSRNRCNAIIRSPFPGQGITVNEFLDSHWERLYPLYPFKLTKTL